MKAIVSIVALVVVASCTNTSTTRLSQNMVRIDASAAPACGRAGADKLVARMAAVETLRAGYDRYQIAAMDSRNNIQTVGATLNTIGTTTTVSPILAGTRDANVVVVMFRSGDPAARNAIDARSALGGDWQAIVAKGTPTTCLD